MLFLEVLPFTTLAVSVNGKTSKKSVQKDAAVFGVSRPLWYLTSSLFAHISSASRTVRNEPCHEKNNVLVSDLVGHKPGCTATEDG